MGTISGVNPPRLAVGGGELHLHEYSSSLITEFPLAPKLKPSVL